MRLFQSSRREVPVKEVMLQACGCWSEEGLLFLLSLRVLTHWRRGTWVNAFACLCDQTQKAFSSFSCGHFHLSLKLAPSRPGSEEAGSRWALECGWWVIFCHLEVLKRLLIFTHDAPRLDQLAFEVIVGRWIIFVKGFQWSRKYLQAERKWDVLTSVWL